MKKKILLGLIALVAVIGSVVAMSAFEAHVVNVTAKIENALSVTPDEIMFGTVFPQEMIDKNIRVALSGSFLEEDRVDDVSYIIRQKPKPRPESYTGNAPRFESERDAQHWCYGNWSEQELPVDYYDVCYYNLCPYLSKHSEGEVGDGSLNAFHEMSEENDVWGYLSKEDGDVEDFWTIDLRVPCFDGMCDQGWEDWVKEVNPDVVDPSEFTLDPSLEHETFGCDLWIEIDSVSTSDTIGIYKETGDDSTTLGEKIGTLHYWTSGGMLNGEVSLNAAGESWIDDEHTYAFVLNGPRNGSIVVGSTNQLLAQEACANSGSGGWWLRFTDNTGDTFCPLPDPLPANYAGAEGYYNFDTTVSGATMNGDTFSIALPSGTYNEVQFLIKDTNTGWNTVGEYPGTGEIDGLTSFFDFSL